LVVGEGMGALGRLKRDGAKLVVSRVEAFPDGKWQACVNRHDVAQ
jgi:hypothetical protein